MIHNKDKKVAKNTYFGVLNMPDGVWRYILIIILSCLALWKDAAWLVGSTARIALWFGVSGVLKVLSFFLTGIVM